MFVGDRTTASPSLVGVAAVVMVQVYINDTRLTCNVAGVWLAEFFYADAAHVQSTVEQCWWSSKPDQCTLITGLYG